MIRDIDFFIHDMSKTAPDRAPKLLRAYMDRQLDALLASPPESPPPPPDDAIGIAKRFWERESEPRASIEKLISRSFHDIEEIAKRSPEIFVRELSPWMIRALGLVTTEHAPRHLSYQDMSLLHVSLPGDDDLHPSENVTRGIHAALMVWTNQNSMAVHEYIQDWMASEIKFLHRLIARVYAEMAVDHPKLGVTYLMGDPRRMSLCEYHADACDTINLIERITPHLPQETLLVFFDHVMKWSCYDESTLKEQDASSRMEMLKWSREHRADLLRAVAPDNLDETRKRIQAEELRAHPQPRPERRVSSMSWVGPPMNTDEMEKAKDQDILNLLVNVPDNQQDYRKFDTPISRSGGSRQLSDAFAAFAEKQPDRALAIMRQLPVETHLRPIKNAIPKFSKAELSLEEFHNLVLEFIDRGASSFDLLQYAASSYEEYAHQRKGLPDNIIDFLEASALETDDSADEDEPENVDDTSEDERQESIFWGHGGLHSMGLPNRNLPALEAISAGYLFRDPIAADEWLESLYRHLHRKEHSSVWRGMTWRWFKNLHFCDRDKAATFLKELFDSHPAMLFGIDGAYTIAHSIWWLPKDKARELIEMVYASPWGLTTQAYSELLMLYTAIHSDTSWTKPEIDRILQTTGDASWRERLGLAHGAVNLWKEPAMKSLSLEIVRALVDDESKAVCGAVLDLFRLEKFDPPLDKRIKEYLDIIIENGTIKKLRYLHLMLEKLLNILHAEPARVSALATQIVDKIELEAKQASSPHYFDTKELTSIAITLSNTAGHKKEGMDLFEKLLELQAYGIDEVLREVDRRPV